MAKRRENTIFSLSFLDIMSCGFGAVILIFIVINHSTEVTGQTFNQQLLAEVQRIEEQVKDETEHLVILRNSIKAQEDEIVTAEELSRRLIETIKALEAEIARMENENQEENIEALKQELKQLEEEAANLEGSVGADETGGTALRTFVGEGDRQYLTGMNVGGEHILILLDASASMLDKTLVNVIRRRNLPDDQKLASAKWQRAIRTVEWIIANMPKDASFQLFTFNTVALPAIPDTGSYWLSTIERNDTDGVIKHIKQVVPTGGTSLHVAFSLAGNLRPRRTTFSLSWTACPLRMPRHQNANWLTARTGLASSATASHSYPPTARLTSSCSPWRATPSPRPPTGGWRKSPAAPSWPRPKTGHDGGLLMKRQRRETEGISLSFLDVISCGFGALILLLVLTKVFDPVILEDTIENLEGYLADLQQTLFNLRGEAKDINRQMLRKEDMQRETQEKLARLNADLSTLQREHEETSDKTKINNLIQGRLAKARQTLTDEMKVLLAEYRRNEDEHKIGGLPIDSEYVIFIIDTSGSMFSAAWPLVLQKVSETLAVYPKLKGIQVMNDMGNYMFTQYTNDWIPDTQARRRAIIERLRYWNVFSNSSPVEGITRAISTYYRPGRKISLYVFGDEFSGRSIQQVVNTIDKINREDADGNRLVRIHGVGFPVQFANPPRHQLTGIKFAMLMRVLCERNGGTFVGLNDFRAF